VAVRGGKELHTLHGPRKKKNANGGK